MDATTGGVLALISTIVLVALHLAAPYLRNLTVVPEHVGASFAGGIAVSYVFLHLIPELAEGHTRLRELLGDERAPRPLVELGIFLVALVGFCLFYALERLAERNASTSGSARGLFWLHLCTFGVYNAVITYTLPLTYRTGVGFAVLFTLAMGLHFVLTDRSLQAHYGPRFDRWPPRLALAGALLAGWLLALLFAPTRAITVSVLTAFLAGSVLLNVFKEELPSARRSSLPWFVTGLSCYALMLLTLTALGTP